MWMILQQDELEDIVVVTRVTTKVCDFISSAFNDVGINLKFEGVDEIGINYSIDEEKYKVISSLSAYIGSTHWGF